MLVAIVALEKYADKNKGKYRSTVTKWIAKAQKDWLDKETGLLASFIDENGFLYEDAPIKGSYSALNCYYLNSAKPPNLLLFKGMIFGLLPGLLKHKQGEG